MERLEYRFKLLQKPPIGLPKTIHTLHILDRDSHLDPATSPRYPTPRHQGHSIFANTPTSGASLSGGHCFCRHRRWHSGGAGANSAPSPMQPVSLMSARTAGPTPGIKVANSDRGKRPAGRPYEPRFTLLQRPPMGLPNPSTPCTY